MCDSNIVCCTLLYECPDIKTLRGGQRRLRQTEFQDNERRDSFDWREQRAAEQVVEGEALCTGCVRLLTARLEHIRDVIRDVRRPSGLT